MLYRTKYTVFVLSFFPNLSHYYKPTVITTRLERSTNEISSRQILITVAHCLETSMQAEEATLSFIEI